MRRSRFTDAPAAAGYWRADGGAGWPARRRDAVDLRNGNGIHDRRAQPSQIVERLLHALHDVRIGVLRREQLPNDAEPHAAHAILVQELRVAVRPLSLTGRRDWIRLMSPPP